MPTYYIYDENNEHFPVWNHRLGKFAIDYDAVYHPSQFGYTDVDYAVKRSQEIMAKLGINRIEVLIRDKLFERIDVRNWTGFK